MQSEQVDANNMFNMATDTLPFFLPGAAMGVRLRRQRTTRMGHVKLIVKSIAKKLRSEQDKTRMMTTDRIIPQGSLRRTCVRDVFSTWILQLAGQGRILTKKLAFQVLVRLRKKFGLPIRAFEEHRDEVIRLHGLLKASRKQQLGKPCSPKFAMSYMDNVDTLPMPDEGPSDSVVDEDFGVIPGNPRNVLHICHLKFQILWMVAFLV